MIFEPQLFYKTFLKNFHRHKATYLKNLLDNLDEYEKKVLQTDHLHEDRNELQLTLKSDLRQTYFHAIETFFELFFALKPKDGKLQDDRSVMVRLTNAKWQDNYKMIREIAENDTALDFLDEKVAFMGYEVSVSHYLFYSCVLPTGKFPDDVFEHIRESLDAAKNGIRIIAQDFIDREEYNAYKHGLRLIPASTKLMLANPETMEVQLEWDISQSMSYYVKPKKPGHVRIETKLFDSERDFSMTLFCSNLIYNMVYYRQLMLYKPDDINAQFAIHFFDKEAIEACDKINVPIQNLVYSFEMTE